MNVIFCFTLIELATVVSLQKYCGLYCNFLAKSANTCQKRKKNTQETKEKMYTLGKKYFLDLKLEKDLKHKLYVPKIFFSGHWVIFSDVKY